jgi:hypothetical protein
MDNRGQNLRPVALAANTADETALLAAYRALKDVDRGYLLGIAQILAEDH